MRISFFWWAWTCFGQMRQQEELRSMLALPEQSCGSILQDSTPDFWPRPRGLSIMPGVCDLSLYLAGTLNASLKRCG
jgi:hypothetical protein